MFLNAISLGAKFGNWILDLVGFGAKKPKTLEEMQLEVAEMEAEQRRQEQIKKIANYFGIGFIAFLALRIYKKRKRKKR